MEQRSICSGVNFRGIRDSKFKTVRMSVHFMLPLEEKTVAANALLPFLISRASREYPDFTRLSQRLSELYGAVLNADVQKLGDSQVLTVSASGIADRYALNGEPICGELSRLLCSVIFDPPFDADGLFPEDGVEQEKRQTIELIDSEYNDKRLYAMRRCEQLLCAGEPYGLSRYGTREEIAAVPRQALTDAWKHMLETARIEVMALGDCDISAAYEEFCRAFQSLRRGETAACKTRVLPAGGKLQTVTDAMEVAQSKLVLGFRTECAVPSLQVPAMQLMAAVYGGTPSSKLFLNVREKLSLCYYCSSGYNSMKGLLFVQSGVETKNIDRAQEEILAQLDSMRKGEFTEEEVKAAKLSLANGMSTLSDSLGGLEAWYLSQAFADCIRTPEEYSALIQAVALEEIAQAAQAVSPSVVYRLTEKEEEAE